MTSLLEEKEQVREAFTKIVEVTSHFYPGYPERYLLKEIITFFPSEEQTKNFSLDEMIDHYSIEDLNSFFDHLLPGGE